MIKKENQEELTEKDYIKIIFENLEESKKRLDGLLEGYQIENSLFETCVS